jgi:hypothetical protein
VGWVVVRIEKALEEGEAVLEVDSAGAVGRLDAKVDCWAMHNRLFT